MEKTRLANVHHLPKNWRYNPQYVYIGRGSYFGNPHPVGSVRECPLCHIKHERGSTLELYREHFYRLINHEDKQLAQAYKDCLEAMRGKTLVCYCISREDMLNDRLPDKLICHGQIIIEYLEEVERNTVP